MNKLPIYRAVVNDDDESGMLTISLVDAPAVEVDFLYFDEDKKPLAFSVENEEERKVLGVVMTADTPIYRRDENGMEYYIVYDKQTIEKMTEKYLKQNRQNNVDLSHIENDKVWSAIKEGTFKGFSLSGIFKTELVQLNKHNNNKTKMKLNKVKQILRSLLVEMGEVSTDKGILVWNGEDELEVGVAVKGMDADGNEVDVEDGEYTTEDKKVIVVKEGKVEDIKEVEEQPIEEQPMPTEAEEVVETPVDEPEDDEKDLKIKELEDTIAAKDAEIEELKAKIAELENEPAAKSAEQTFAETVVNEDNSPKAKMAKRGYRFQ